MASATNVRILGNFLGTSRNGAFGIPNASGVFVSEAPGVTIGGTVSGARNVISGNVGNGISLSGLDAPNALIQGNYIGLNVSGTAVLANNADGVNASGKATVIGGTTPEARNVIVGSGHFGVVIRDSGGGSDGANSVVQGNYIGVGPDGSTPFGNGGGVRVNGSPNVTVGGTAPGAGNVIAYNSGVGVDVELQTGGAVRGNAIFSNGGIGIDLGGDSVTPNDAGDADTGSNNLQNFPVLTTAAVGASKTRVTGTLNSTASTTYQIDLYANTSCDASGNGEGQIYLGSTTATTNGSGDAIFAATSLTAAAASAAITSTATDPNGNTSEFSACKAATSPAVVVSPTTLTVAEGGAAGSFSVALNSVPTSAVTVSLSFDASQLIVTPTTFTFQPDITALTPQTATITAVNDATAEATATSQIGLAAASSDAAYAGISIGNVAVAVNDNDGPQACAPRPRVQTRVAAGGGKLQVAIEPTPLNTNLNNRLVGIRFGQLQNARVTVNGQVVAAGQTVPTAANTVELDFTLERVTPGQPAMAFFTIIDSCGEWQTFVGGGTAAGF
jgi:hypothetical protein